jgi:hypothetical protein
MAFDFEIASEMFEKDKFLTGHQKDGRFVA